MTITYTCSSVEGVALKQALTDILVDYGKSFKCLEKKINLLF